MRGVERGRRVKNGGETRLEGGGGRRLRKMRNAKGLSTRKKRGIAEENEVDDEVSDGRDNGARREAETVAGRGLG